MNRMQRRLKRALMCTLAIAVLTGSSAVTANAQKREFAFTATKDRVGRTAPAFKGDDEQVAYVTTTYHSNSRKTSIGVDNGSQLGIVTTNWTFSKPTKKKPLHYYSGYADMKTTFYLYYEAHGSGSRTIYGRYNP